MYAVRKLARAIHRRSVWQVVAAYLALSWIGYEGVAFLTERVGLPEWTPPMAAVLLAIGFPVVLATTLVQGGLPWLRIQEVVDPSEIEVLTPEDVLVIPQLHPMYGIGIFTWRNAVLGGVMALALLVTSVVAYLTMWALGIGPVGSLLAQGLVEESDRVLVVFINRTEEMELGDAVGQAFRADFAQSTVFRVVDPRLEGSPSVEGGAALSELTPALARRMLGSAADVLVEGEVTREGSGYMLEVGIVLPASPTPVARFREAALTPEDLVPAIDVLSERVRAKLGESLRHIRADPPLAEVFGTAVRPPS